MNEVQVALRPPIIVWEPRNIELFASIERACEYLEPPDVNAGTPTAYDSEGRRLTLQVVEVPVRAFGRALWHVRRVRVVDCQREPLDAHELRTILATALGVGPADTRPLAELVTAAQERFGTT